MSRYNKIARDLQNGRLYDRNRIYFYFDIIKSQILIELLIKTKSIPNHYKEQIRQQDNVDEEAVIQIEFCPSYSPAPGIPQPIFNGYIKSLKDDDLVKLNYLKILDNSYEYINEINTITSEIDSLREKIVKCEDSNTFIFDDDDSFDGSFYKVYKDKECTKEGWNCLEEGWSYLANNKTDLSPKPDDEKAKLLERFNSSFRHTSESKNIILMGAPGAGKSSFVDEVMCPWLVSTFRPEDRQNYIERVCFYPGISFEDIWGSYKPVTDDYGKTSYEFVPESFLICLDEALGNPLCNYVYVIEELNRTQIYEAFGFIFQMLDRGHTVSCPTDVKNSKKLSNINGMDRLYIPDNMYIICTMNPCDQNIQDLDIAFLRRFNLGIMSINQNIICPNNFPFDKEQVENKSEITTEIKGVSNKKWMYSNVPLDKKYLTDDFIKDKVKLINRWLEKKDDNYQLSKYYFGQENVDLCDFIIQVLYYLNSVTFEEDYSNIFSTDNSHVIQQKGKKINSSNSAIRFFFNEISSKYKSKKSQNDTASLTENEITETLKAFIPGIFNQNTKQQQEGIK